MFFKKVLGGGGFEGFMNGKTFLMLFKQIKITVGSLLKLCSLT